MYSVPTNGTITIIVIRQLFIIFRCLALLSKIAELGTRQFFRDNVIMFSGYKVVCNCHFTICVVATASRH